MSLSLSFQPTVLFSSSHDHTQQQGEQGREGERGREEGQLSKKEVRQQQQPLNQIKNEIDSGPLPTKRFAVELVKPEEEEDHNKRWNTIIEQFQAAISAATATVTHSPNVLNEPFALGYVASGLDACLNWLSLGRNHFTESVEMTTTTAAATGNANILTEESLLGMLTLLKHTFSLIILPSTDPNYTQPQSQLQSSPPTKIKSTTKRADRIRITDSPDDTKDDFAPDSSRSRKRGRSQRSAAIVDGNILRGLIVQSCGILDGFAAFIDLCIVSEPILHMLASTALSAVFAGGRSLIALQMSAIRVLTAVASCSAAQRDSLIADVILNISQYSGSAAALRLFKATTTTTEESDQNAAAINVVSALVLALIQSCGTRDKGWHTQAERTVQHPYKHSIICAKKLVVSLIQQLVPAASANTANAAATTVTVTAKPFLPYFVQDVLTVFNTPEWPCAELVLHLLVSGLIDLQHNPRSGAAIDLLGTIGARIRAESEPTALLPPADAKGTLCCRCRALLNAAMGVVLTCSDCGRSFHIECVPRSAVPDTPCAPWVCSDCVTVRSIRADLAKIVSGSSDSRYNAHLSSDYVATTPVKTAASQRSTEEVTTKAEAESATTDKERCNSGTPPSVIESLNLVNKQLIHNYLVSETARTGSVFCEDARRFLISQWSTELFQEGVSLPPGTREALSQFYSAHWVLGPAECFAAAAAQRTLPRDAVLRAVRIVGAEHGVMRSFDAVLACVLRLLGDAQATVRARAVRTLGEIVCAAQGSALLSLPVVQRAVQMRLIDTAVSVRQQAVDLVGRHITQCRVGRDALALYFGAIVDRASDTGVSVRKQAVRILEGVCLSREIGESSPLLVVNACKCLARRVVADDEPVKAMVLRTFRALWFSPPAAAEGGSLEATAAAMRKRAEQIVAVVSVSYSADRGEWLQLLFASVLRVPPPSTSNSVSAAAMATSVRDATAGTLVCEQLCEAFMDLLVSTESRLAQRNGNNNGGNNGGTQGLQRVMAWTLCSLRLMCGVAPNLLCKHVLNIVPYMVPPQQQQASTQEEGEIACAAMAIVEATFPLMQGIQDSVLDKTERDLVTLLTKTPAPPFNVVRAAVRCLGVIVTRVRPNVPLMTRLFTHFYTLASTAFNNNIINNNNNINIINNFGSATPDAVLSLYALGYLCQSYDFDAVAGGIPSCGIAAGCVSSAIRTLYTSSAPGSSGNIPLEARRLQGYGAALGRWPALTNDPATTNLFSWALRSNDTVTNTVRMQNPQQLQQQQLQQSQQSQSVPAPAIQETALVVITELLRSRVELIGDEERAKPLVLAGTSLACTHSKAILGLVVHSADVRVRNAAVGVADLIARHGVVDPGLTVPSLIAMLAIPANAPKAYSTLSYILEKYPGSLGPRLSEGIALSYSVQTRTGGCGGVARAVLWPRGNGTAGSGGGGGDGDENDGGCSPHILVGRLFSLVKNKSARIAFVNTLLRPLEDVVEDPTAIAQVDPLFLAYVAEIAAFLPLETQDELHLICAKADHAILLRGAEATDILKKSIISSSSILPSSSSSLTSLSSSSSSLSPSSSLTSLSPSSSSLPSSSSSSIEIKNDNYEMSKSVTLTFAVSIFVTLKEFMRKMYGNVAKSFTANNVNSNTSSSSSLTTTDSTPTGNSKLSISIETITFGKDISGKDSLFSEQIGLLNSPVELRNFFKNQLSGDDADKDLATKEFGKYNRSGKRRGGGRGRKRGKDVTGPQQIKVEE